MCWKASYRYTCGHEETTIFKCPDCPDNKPDCTTSTADMRRQRQEQRRSRRRNDGQKAKENTLPSPSPSSACPSPLGATLASSPTGAGGDHHHHHHHHYHHRRGIETPAAAAAATTAGCITPLPEVCQSCSKYDGRRDAHLWDSANFTERPGLFTIQLPRDRAPRRGDLMLSLMEIPPNRVVLPTSTPWRGPPQWIIRGGGGIPVGVRTL